MSSPTSRNQVVLLVDDDPIVLAVNQERLEQLGYTVHVRDQVLGTSQWIVKNDPWMAILDVMMPAMSGGELALFLRKRGISTHVVLHSSKDLDELRELMQETGALGVIPKGLSDAEFERQFTALARLAQRRGSSGAAAPPRGSFLDSDS